MPLLGSTSLVFRLSKLIALLLLVFISVTIATAPSPGQQSANTRQLKAIAMLPLLFEPNEGQAPESARFVARGTNLTASLRSTGIDLSLGKPRGRSAALTLTFVGANKNPDLVPSDEQASYTNYILGNRRSDWISHIPNFGRVAYKGIYPGIDAAFHGNGYRLEHDFIIRPGADYRQIRIHVARAVSVKILPDGDLALSVQKRDVVFQKPNAYQYEDGVKSRRPGRFVLLGKHEFGFDVANYDRSRILVIDPVLTYSTYIADVSINAAAVATDSAGDTFLTGLTFDSTFPTTPGAYQTTCKSCGGTTQQPDVFVTKINSTGTALVYSTFLGGSDYDQPYGIAIDAAGDAVVAGRTQSSDFPVKNPIPVGTWGVGTSYGFITSLSPGGSTLNYSSLLGGGSQPMQSSSTGIAALALDSGGNAYVAGITDSPVFPTTPGALDALTPNYPESVGFVTKFVPAGTLGYSALIGDTAPQNGGGGLIGLFGIAVDAAGDAYITGSAGTLWPTTAGAFQTTIPGTAPYAAPFVTKLSANGSTLLYSTFISHGGQPTGIVVEQNSGDAFITGAYAPSDFPTTAGAYLQSTGSSSDSFFTELSADGSSLVYSSFFGVNSASYSTTSTTGIALDASGNIWLVGTTNSAQFPLKFPLQSLVATSPVAPVSTTAFMSRFDPTGKVLMFSSYFGGTAQGGMIAGVAIDPLNHAHVAGTTGDGLFTTVGAYLATAPPPPANVQNTYGFAAVIDADTPGPSVCFNPQFLQWGNVRVGTSSSETLALTNCGNAPLTINSAQSSSPLFAVPGGSNGCQQAVVPGASCTIGLTFSPTSVGDDSATLTIDSNASVSSSSITMTGVGAAPQISVQAASITFDPQFVGQTSPQQFLSISNTGGVPLTINLSQTTISAGFAYTQSGCDQPIGSCSMLLTFTPQAAGTLNGTLNIASDDPNNPIVSVALSGTGYTSYPAPSLTYLSSPTIQAGSTGVSLRVTGSNFFPASTVLVGGVAQPTTYQNSSYLTATVDPSLLATMGELQVTVSNPSPGGGVSSPLALTVYESIPVDARALLYDPVGQLLYASIGSAATNNPNTIAVIDPLAGNVTQYIPVGNDPKCLAISDDGQYLYVSLDGDHAIQRINLKTLAIEKTFSLPVDSSFGQLTVYQMKVVPGSPQSVVAALFRVASPAEDGIALFNDSGLVNWLPNDYSDGYISVDSFAFVGNPPIVYSLPVDAGSPSNFGVFTIDSSGIHVQSGGTSGITGQVTGFLLASDGTLLYTNSGQVWNPPSTLVGTYNPSVLDAPSIIPDDSAGRTFFLDQFGTYDQYGATSIDAYDQNSFALAGSVPFLSTVVFGPDAAALNRWGANGFAFAVAGSMPVPATGQVILFRSSIAFAAPSTNPAPVLNTLSTSTVSAGSLGFVLGLQGSGFVPGSVVQWNGSALATTLVTATQLTAVVPAADISQPGSAQLTVVNPAPGGGTSSALSLTIGPPAPAATLQPGSLTFASQTVSTQSAAQTITLGNSGGATLTVSGIQASGDFSETNNCPTSLASAATCTVSVIFAPTTTGTRQGTISVADNAAGSPQTIALAGTGTAPNFSFGTGGSNNTSATVTAGQTADYSLSIVSGQGSSGAVQLSCTQVPIHATCTMNPSTLTLTSGSTAAFTVQVSTGVSQSASLISRFPLAVSWFGLIGFLALPLLPQPRQKRRLSVRMSSSLLLVVALAAISGLVACGGGGGSAGASLTPQGTYTLQIAAKEGPTTQTQAITLTVN